MQLNPGSVAFRTRSHASGSPRSVMGAKVSSATSKSQKTRKSDFNFNWVDKRQRYSLYLRDKTEGETSFMELALGTMSGEAVKPVVQAFLWRRTLLKVYRVEFPMFRVHVRHNLGRQDLGQVARAAIPTMMASYRPRAYSDDQSPTSLRVHMEDIIQYCMRMEQNIMSDLTMASVVHIMSLSRSQQIGAGTQSEDEHHFVSGVRDPVLNGMLLSSPLPQ